MISTDRKIFEEGSNVRARQVDYAKDWDEVHIVIFSKKDHREITVSSNCWVYPTRSFSKYLYPFDAIKLGRFIIAKRGITHITCQDASLTAMAGLALKNESHLPLEIQVHEDLGSPFYAHRVSNRIRKTLALKYLPQADSVRVVSERIRNYLVDKIKIDANKVTVKPIAIDVSWIESAPVTVDLHKKYPQFSKIVLMASRLEKEKNFELALHSWKGVIGHMADAGLIIVGEGSMEEKIKSLSASLGVVQNVIVEKWADKTTLASYYKTADLFLNTSLFEGYGMTLIEAKAAGLPVVSTDVGVARESGANIVDNEPGDVCRKIVQALNNNK